MVSQEQSFSSKFLFLVAFLVLVAVIKNANCAPFDEAGNQLAFLFFLLCCRELFVSLVLIFHFLMDIM